MGRAVVGDGLGWMSGRFFVDDEVHVVMVLRREDGGGGKDVGEVMGDLKMNGFQVLGSA